jgi:hypothetical protein
MLQSNQPPYPEALSKFLTAQAAQLDAQPGDPTASPFDAVRNASMYEGVPLMPPEFQLMHPRRVQWSGWFPQPDGALVHFIGARDATPEQEIWHRINYPERGLHPDDRRAYRKSKRSPVSKFFARLKFRGCPTG